jgi:DNA-binding CsgD family transcriptional regulator
VRGVLEREHELTQLRAALERTAEGDGGVLAVEGPAGIGRSLLLEHARRQAAERGMTALAARAGELEQAFSFGVVCQLLERELQMATAERRSALLSGPAALAAPAVGVEVGAEPTPVDAAFSVFHGLYWLVANLAVERPMLLAVDDLQWADAPSLRALLYLASRLEGLPVLLLVSVRSGEPCAEPRLLEQLLAEAGAALHPAPLSTAGVATLLEARTGSAADADVVAAATRATGGNPFLLDELVRSLPGDDRDGSALRPRDIEQIGSRAVARSLLLRLGRLPGAAVAVARAVAVLNTHAELRHVAALAGVDEREAAAAVDALTTAGFLGPERPLAFRQPMVRTCIAEDMTAVERAGMHAHAAALLRDAGLSPGELAPHLLATEPDRDAEVVELLRVAAGRVLRQGAPDLAQRYLRRALREPPPASVLPCVLGELGDAEWLSGEDPDAAIAHLTEALERTDDHALRPDRALSLHRALFATNRLVEAYELLEREIARLTGVADPEALMRLESALSSIGLLNPATVARANERLARFEQLGGNTPAELLQIANVACWKWAAGTAEETIEFGRRALADARAQAADPADSLPIYEALWVLSYADAHELALSVIEDTLADARARGSVFGISTSCALRAIIAMQRGDVAAAEIEARSAAVLPGLSDFVRPPVFGALTLALVARGDLEGAERAIEESGCGPGLPEFVCLNPAFYARGMLRLAQGRCEEALADFSEFGERSRRINLRNPGDPWRLGAAEALTRLGYPDEAAELADEQLELARRWGTRSAIGVALHGHAMAHGADPERLAAATEELAESPARLDHARSLVDLGAALRRANRRAEAREPLREGLELATRCGATALSQRAHDELLVAGARPRRLMFSGPEALTPSERRVAELAADGQSNREIAQALFVTTKTVDNHLGRVYTKLGISSRSELPAALLDPAGDDEALAAAGGP